MRSRESLLNAAKLVKRHRIKGNTYPLIAGSMVCQASAEINLDRGPVQCTATHTQVDLGRVSEEDTSLWNFIAVEPIVKPKHDVSSSKNCKSSKSQVEEMFPSAMESVSSRIELGFCRGDRLLDSLVRFNSHLGYLFNLESIEDCVQESRWESIVFDSLDILEQIKNR